MGGISIGDALGEGFGLIRRQPLTVMIWGLLQMAWSLVTLVALTPASASMAAAINSESAVRAAGRMTGPQAMAFLGPILGFESLFLLVALISGCVSLILYCAAFRSVLKPVDNRFAYLRLGWAELFLMLFSFGLVIGLWLAAILALIPIILIAAAAGVAHLALVAVLVGFVGFIGVIALVLWIAVRFSFVGPMTVEDGSFHLTDAWRLSKGRAGALFLIGLCLFVVACIAAVLQLVLTLAFGGDQAQYLMSAFRPRPGGAPAHALPPITPQLVIRYVISIPISGCLIAIFGAPWARAYRDTAQPDIAATFA